MKKKNRRNLEECRDLLWDAIEKNHMEPEGLTNTQLAIALNDAHRLVEKVLKRVNGK